MFKNVASQKIRVFAYDYTTGQPKTGDAANITAYVSKDRGAVTALGDTSATESDATNAPGSYLFDLTQAETNADVLDFSAKSSTSNIRIAPIDNVQTFPASFTAFVTPTNLTAAQIATGVWQDTTAGDFTAALSVGKSVMNGVTLGTGLTIAAVSGACAVTSNIKKNSASRITFVMTDSTTHAPKTGCTVTAQVSLDGAAFVSCTNSPSELTGTSGGVYTLVLAAGDTNANELAYRLTASSADDLVIERVTQP